MADEEQQELRVFAAVRQHDALLESLLQDAEQNPRVLDTLQRLAIQVVERDVEQLVQFLR